MTAVIEKEINLARTIESLKRDLEIGLDYTAVAAFRSVDRYNSGLVTTVNLGAFLRDQGHWASETELLAIVRRIDTDGDASIDLREWSEFMRPAAAPTAAIAVSTLPLPPVPYVPSYVPPYSRYWWDYPASRYYADPLYRPWWDYTRPYPAPLPVPLASSPVAKTEKIEVERGPYWHSPSRTVKKTTYHTPSGDRTYSTYI